MKTSGVTFGIIGTASFFALLGCTQLSMAVPANSVASSVAQSPSSRWVDVAVVNRTTGERLNTYRHAGKWYVAGTPGDRYAVELKSRHGERVLSVLSIDGVNVLTGQTAATLQSGYVLEGSQAYSISGWRKTMDDVAQFVFTSLPNSYAARTGRPANVGVIGVAVFREKPLPEVQIMPQPAVSAAPAPAREPMSYDRALGKMKAENSTAAESRMGGAAVERRAETSAPMSPMPAKKSMQLGTGHGEREYAPTRQTEFARNSDTPDEVITLYYDSRPNLIARGIIPSPRLAEPTPFPAGIGFVPDPKG